MIKVALSVMIFLVSLVLSFPLSIRLFAQYQYSKAANLTRNKEYEGAVSCLIKATRLQDGESRNWKALGEAYHLLGVSKPFVETYRIALKAKEADTTASRLNPIDADIFFHLAVAERRLEQLYPFFHTDENPHDLLPYLYKAISLYPKNLLYHYFLADYLFNKKEMDALRETVFHIASIAPNSYAFFKKQAYWNPEVRDTFRKGLLQAIQTGTYPAAAHNAMSSLLKDTNK